MYAVLYVNIFSSIIEHAYENCKASLKSGNKDHRYFDLNKLGDPRYGKQNVVLYIDILFCTILLYSFLLNLNM